MTKGVQDRMIAVEKLRDAFHAAVFVRRDVAAAAALLTEDAGRENRPGTRASGLPDVRRSLAGLVDHSARRPGVPPRLTHR